MQLRKIVQTLRHERFIELVFFLLGLRKMILDFSARTQTYHRFTLVASHLVLLRTKTFVLVNVVCSHCVGCWFVRGDDFTGALRVLQLQLSPPLPPFLASIKSANSVSPGK